MRYSAVILIMAIALSALGCEEDQGVSEVVSRPDVPAGPDTASCTYPVVFSTGGAVSNKGSEVEYRFDFDSEQDHIYGSWRSSASDTVVWEAPGPAATGDTLFPKAGNGFLYYEFALRARGHDDARDLPGSAVKSWRFNITGSGRDYDFSYEGGNLFPVDTTNELLRSTAIQIPLDNETGLPDSAFVAGLPSFMGPQDYRVIGYDMGSREIYTQKIRMTSPTFDEYWNVIEKGAMYNHVFDVSNYGRKDTLSGGFYLKTLW